MNHGSSARVRDVLRAWVAQAPAGARLPSSRTLVADLAVSPLTVQAAVRALVAEGLVETRPGVGTFVRATRPHRRADHAWQTAALGAPPAAGVRLPAVQRDPAPGAIALQGGYPTGELLPERLVRAALARASRSPAATARVPAAGLPDLRAWFAADLAGDDPAGPSAHDVVVLPGSQSGLGSVFRAVVRPGAPLLVESPTYWGAVLAAAQAGARLVPVPSGPHGPDPDDVARAFEESGARAFYAQPTYANPTGAQWTPGRARAVHEVVVRYGAFLVEDDWAHDLAIDTCPEPLARHDEDGHVVHLRSLTKSVSPALRVAAVVARGPVRDRLLADHAAQSMYVSGVLQAAALDVVTQPAWRTHLRGLGPALRTRRDLLLAALREHAPQLEVEHVPPGGLGLWARLPDGTDATAFARACESRGVLVGPGDEWFPAEPAAPYVRLTYGGPDVARFGEAARVLGEVLSEGGASG